MLNKFDRWMNSLHPAMANAIANGIGATVVIAAVGLLAWAAK